MTHLVDIDRDPDYDVQQITECQAADQDVGPVTHALVLVDDPQQGGVADDAHHKHQARHHRVDVLKGVPDFCRPGAHWRQPSARHANVGPHRPLHVPLHQPRFLRDLWKVHCRFVLLLPASRRHVARQEDKGQAHQLSPHPGVCSEIGLLVLGNPKPQTMWCETEEQFIPHTVNGDITGVWQTELFFASESRWHLPNENWCEYRLVLPFLDQFGSWVDIWLVPQDQYGVFLLLFAF